MTSEARLDMKPDAEETRKTVSLPAQCVTLSTQDFLALKVSLKNGFTPNPALQKALAVAVKIKQSLKAT